MNAQDLKNSILQLAVQGKLVEQRAEEGTARELLEQIKLEKEQTGRTKPSITMLLLKVIRSAFQEVAKNHSTFFRWVISISKVLWVAIIINRTTIAGVFVPIRHTSFSKTKHVIS